MRLLLKSLGPGVITGAADDDPSGIATYSVAGAQLGTKLLWTALLTWPLMAAVQMMCARIGKVTGQGLAANFKQRFPSWLLRVVIVALLAANTINIAADLAGMADAAEMLSRIKAHFFVVVFALLISWATIRLHYHQIANVLKWLVLVQETDAGPAEFPLGMDCRSDHHCDNARRGRSHVRCLECGSLDTASRTLAHSSELCSLDPQNQASQDQ